MVKLQHVDIADDPDKIVAEFRKRFYDTELFFDPYAKLIYPRQNVSITRVQNDPRDRLAALVEAGSADVSALLAERVVL